MNRLRPFVGGVLGNLLIDVGALVFKTKQRAFYKQTNCQGLQRNAFWKSLSTLKPSKNTPLKPLVETLEKPSKTLENLSCFHVFQDFTGGSPGIYATCCEVSLLHQCHG